LNSVAHSVLIIFTQAAREELIEAQDWYEGEATGQVRRFREAIDALIGRETAGDYRSSVRYSRGNHLRRPGI
jgi:hypothetical protein